MTNLSQFVWDWRVSQNMGLSVLKPEQFWENQEKLVTLTHLSIIKKGKFRNQFRPIWILPASHIQRRICELHQSLLLRHSLITGQSAASSWSVNSNIIQDFCFVFQKHLKSFRLFFTTFSYWQQHVNVLNLLQQMSNSSASQIPCIECDIFGRVLLTLIFRTKVRCGES